MCIVRIANNINRNVYMHLNTRIFPTTGYARVLLFMFIRLELGGMVQDVYFSLHTVILLTTKDNFHDFVSVFKYQYYITSM